MTFFANFCSWRREWRVMASCLPEAEHIYDICGAISEEVARETARQFQTQFEMAEKPAGQTEHKA